MTETTVDNIHSSDADNVSSIEDQEIEHNVPNSDDEAEEEAETFPREYVEKLRDENAKYRQRAQQSDELATRLHTTMVEATGRLADPTDLPFEESHLEDTDALHSAIDALLESKPHLAARKPVGSIGQGAVSDSGSNVDLVGLLRAGT